jgi:drug/metabolite transporter (DMT)-like permease
MLYFFLCLLLNIWIFVTFRLFKTTGVRTLEAICVNYLVCMLTGGIFLDWSSFNVETFILWWPFALLLGAMFITTFFLLGQTTQRMGMSVASVTSKTSMAIPIVLALILIPSEQSWMPIQYVGLALAFPAIIAVSIKKDPNSPNQTKIGWQPFALFVMSGLIDALLNYSNAFEVPEQDAGFFTWTLFSFAGFFGWFYLIWKKRWPGLRELGAGVVLGIPNYFSIFFLILSLAYFNFNGAIFFPMLNVGIMMGSTIVSAFFFKEKLSALNILGLIIAVLAVVFLSWSQIVEYLA